MKNKKYGILAALLLPIICLILLAVYKQIKISTGKTIIIPITGYDPRDLLSGHYLTYRLDIQSDNICSGDSKLQEDIYLCLVKKEDGSVTGYQIAGIPDTAGSGCGIVIKGRCEYNRFTAGIERFYIPEQNAADLDSVVRRGKCSLLVKIDGKGNAAIRDLLIDGRSWKEYVKE